MSAHDNGRPADELAPGAPHVFDVHDAVEELCRILGLDPSHVAELVLRPNEARATFYLVNDDGRKYVDPLSNAAALGQRTYRITT